MKKILAILCLICLCFTFSACNQQTTEADETTEVEEIQQEDESQTDLEEDVEVEETTEISIDENETDEVEEETKAERTTDVTTTTTNETTTVSTTTVASSSTTKASSSTTTKADNTTSTTTTKAAETTTTKSTTTTAATTTTTKATTTTQAQNYCYVTIDMTNALKNISDFTTAKASFVPSSGILLNKTKIYYNEGETLFDAILRACSENVCSDNCKYCQSSGIQIEYQYTPAYNSYYIEGVHQIYEMDCGVMSGWMVYVNSQSIQSSSSTIEIQNGDNIVLAYTCSMGSDINF